MSAATCRKCKAVLLICLLAVAEARRITHRQDVSFNAGCSLRSSTEVDTKTTVKPLNELVKFLLAANPATAFSHPRVAFTHGPCSAVDRAALASSRRAVLGLQRGLRHNVPPRLMSRESEEVAPAEPTIRDASHVGAKVSDVSDTNPLKAFSTNNETEEALRQTLICVIAAGAFCFGVLGLQGGEAASQWISAYILEESLSVDNLIVFKLIFDYFQTPASAQPRVLRWGLLAAVVLRASFILGGLAVVQRFKTVQLVFAGILIYSAYGLLQGEDEEEEDLSNNAVVKLTKQYLPSTDKYDGDKFFTTGLDGSTLATPLLLALVCVEISDVIFAVDSIPAVFGVTTDPFVAFTSNLFAILGLRALYTIVSTAVGEFEFLTPAIAVVLSFIGAKLIACYFGYEVPTEVSLLLVVGILSLAVAASVLTSASEMRGESIQEFMPKKGEKNSKDE